jgi:hypothetical protein
MKKGGFGKSTATVYLAAEYAGGGPVVISDTGFGRLDLKARGRSRPCNPLSRCVGSACLHHTRAPSCHVANPESDLAISTIQLARPVTRR